MASLKDMIFKNDADPSGAAKSQKNTKMILLIGVGGLVIIIMMMTGGNGKEKEKIGDFKLVKEEDAVKTRFMGDVKHEMYGVRHDADTMEAQYKQQKMDMNRIRKEMRELKMSLDGMKKEVKANGVQASPHYPPAPRTAVKDPNEPRLISGFRSGLEGREKPAAPKIQKMTVKQYRPLSDFFGSEIDYKPSGKKKSYVEQKRADNLLPSGSILHARLLSGIDAPTLSKAKRNAIPLLMKVTDLGILPNSFRYDVKDCFILGEGYGDLSAERVYIRTTTLSCVTTDGFHIDGELTGFVAGPDAKNGIRGRVVTKQGGLLARSAVAGFLKGMSNGFNLQNQTVTQSALGTTIGPSALSTTDVMKMGVFSGAAEAADRLSEFYMDLADEMTPVIELSANIEADVIVTEMKLMETIEGTGRDTQMYKQDKRKMHDKQERQKEQHQNIRDAQELKQHRKEIAGR